MSLNSYCCDKQVVDAIKELIDQKKAENKLSILFPNNLLREDIFPILDMFCTVVFYPLSADENNGFHKAYTIGGKKEQFVFINTNKPNSLQVFTAAHELGHIWNVGKIIKDRLCNTNDINIYDDERIISRFAAELLMPEQQFMEAYSFLYKEIMQRGRNSGENVLRLIAEIMAMFWVPYEAAVKRMAELELIQSISADKLLSNNDPFAKKIIDDYMQKIMNELGYQKLTQASGKKWINGLPELLNTAQLSGVVSNMKIEKIREDFEIFEDKTTTSEDVLSSIPKI